MAFLNLSNWFSNNWLEITGTIAGIIYILLSIKQNIWLWPIGIISSALSLVVFLNSKLYADMFLQAYYIIISIYGFIHWLNGNSINTENAQHHNLPIVKISAKVIVFLISIFLSTTIVMFWVLKQYTDASIPFWDSVVTAGSLVATWMLAQKYIENWIVWIFIDFISMFLFIYKELYFFAALFLIYVILAFIGYFEWKNAQKQAVNQ